MRFIALACDYDGTLATDGRIGPELFDALQRVQQSGRKLIMVTGRQLEDLFSVFPGADRFDWIVAENGAVLHEPGSGATIALGEPPPNEFVEGLRARGVDSVSVGRVIAATWHPHETVVLEVIRELGLELHVIFNKGAVMVLPSGLNKATGLQAVLKRLAISPHNVVGVGDAENDHAFLSVCECSVAVANALPSLKQRVDHVTAAARGEGVCELIEALLDGDLGRLEIRLHRHDLRLGTRTDGEPVKISPYGPVALLSGPSGSGKSTLATVFMEQLLENGYQFCVLDPEGDYEHLTRAVVIGNQQQEPDIAEVLEILENPEENIVVNLLGIGIKRKALFAEALLVALTRLRKRTGRPHWILVDESHQLLGPGITDNRPDLGHSTMLITVHPEHLDRTILTAVDPVIAVGGSPHSTLVNFAAAANLPTPSVPFETQEPEEAVFWSPRSGNQPACFRRAITSTERRRHGRKYAAGELGPDKSFYFRGPDNRLRLRAHNLSLFLEIADGVDEATWDYHRQRGDYSRWLCDVIKDEELARSVAELEQNATLSSASARGLIRGKIEAKYSPPS